MTQAELRRLARRRVESEEAWRGGIRRAHAEGMSLRVIAAAAGVSHPRVLQIVRGE